MSINFMRSLTTGATLLAVGLLLDSAAPRAWGQFGATFVSATPESPIALGQPLNITVVVANDTGMEWTAGELGASWLTELDQPSWLPSAPPIDFITTTTVPDSETASMIVTLEPAELPDSPGDYSVRLYTAYNLLDLDFYLMIGGPKTVYFVINAPSTNHPVVIPPIGDRAVVVTNLLSFTVEAQDPDLPAQTLTFNLEPGAPANASIDAASGLFTWIPPAGPTPRTNGITVRVTDDGLPPSSATNSFNVVVLPPPRFEGIYLPTNGVVVLVWPTFPGKTYQVSYKDELQPGPWTTLGDDILATEPFTSVTNNVGAVPQRFYRLSILD